MKLQKVPKRTGLIVKSFFACQSRLFSPKANPMNKSAILPVRHLTTKALTCVRGGVEIFVSVNLHLSAGEVLLLRGPNGVGKTSLLLCLAGYLRPAEGEIIWEGRDPEDLNGEDIHFVGHQSAVKSGLTVAENLAFWGQVNSNDPVDISGPLQAAGLSHAAHLDAAFLSTGQTRRLALARLLVSPRPIWLLDEPNASLDKQGDKWVAGLIDNHLNCGGLVVATTHLDLALKQSNRVKTHIFGGGK